MLDTAPFPLAPVEYCDVSGDAEAYHHAFARWWADGRGLLNVEQDMVPSGDQLRELAECPQDWCAFAYLTPRGIIPALGCVKFSTPLLRQYPGVMTRAGEPDADLVPPRHWWRLDVRLERALLAAGAIRHLHPGLVTHLHLPDPTV